MPTPPNMLRARTRGITRLSWSMTKVRKLELTGTRHEPAGVWRAPNGSRSSSGRNGRGRKELERLMKPVGGQRNSSLLARARQLQALVRQQPLEAGLHFQDF